MQAALWGAVPSSGQPGYSVECEACGKEVVLRPAICGAGWRIVHECETRRIETKSTDSDPSKVWRYVCIAAGGV